MTMNSALPDRLIQRMKAGECLKVPHAIASDLREFNSARSKCHENVNRWCKENPGHKPARGWLITGTAVFDKHSVVDRGPGGLLDITPLDDRSYSYFLPHDETQDEFEKLPNQVIAPGI
jgi:hypothetical protein